LNAAKEVVVVEGRRIVVLIVDLNVKLLLALEKPIDFEEFLPFWAQVVLLRFCLADFDEACRRLVVVLDGNQRHGVGLKATCYSHLFFWSFEAGQRDRDTIFTFENVSRSTKPLASKYNRTFPTAAVSCAMIGSIIWLFRRVFSFFFYFASILLLVALSFATARSIYIQTNKLYGHALDLDLVEFIISCSGGGGHNNIIMSSRMHLSNGLQGERERPLKGEG
jgi:hypothetical protein